MSITLRGQSVKNHTQQVLYRVLFGTYGGAKEPYPSK